MFINYQACQHFEDNIYYDYYNYNLRRHMSNAKKPGCLGYLGDYTTQICGD